MSKRTDSKRPSRQYGHLVAGIGLTCSIALFLYLKPSRMANPLFRKDVIRGDTPHSGVWEERFTITKAIPKFQVQTYVEQNDADLRMDLAGREGCEFLRGLTIPKGHAGFSCGRDVAAGVYTVRVYEANVKGRYRIEIGSEAGTTRWQKFLVLLGVLFVVSSIVYLWQWTRKRKGRPGRGFAKSRAIFLLISLAVFVLFLYLLLHEGGHALASLCFGNFDFTRSDFSGLRGAPHSGVRPDIQLESWQTAIQSFAGPFLPTLAGYVVFCLWRLKWAKELRNRRVIVDLFWSFSLVMMLFPHIGTVLPIFGFRADGDYSGFINNVPLSEWQTNLVLLLIAVVNGYVLYHVVRHLLDLKRRLLKERSA